jgi:hypothetical protein
MHFCCVSGCDLANSLKSIGVRNPVMAEKEKKVEAIHLRVSATSKARLEALSNALGKNSTRVVEDLVAEAAARFEIMGVDGAVADHLWLSGTWNLLEALQLAHVPNEPILKKLRTWFLAVQALSQKDRVLTETILRSPEIFSGETEIFLESEGVIENPDERRTFKVDLDEINRQMPSLQDYAAFRLKNKQISPSYRDYLKMIEEKKTSQLD